MNAKQLASQISKMQVRAEQLRHEAVRVPEAPAVLQSALVELFTSVEELRVAEEELREQNDALVQANAEIERERRRYAELFQLAPVAYLVTDARGVLTEVNRAAATLLQQPAGGLVGKPIALMLEVADRERWRALLARMVGGDATRPAETVRLQLGERTIRVRIEGSIRAEGASGSCHWALDDISARELAGEAERLVADARRKDEFLAMLGHELRNPLAPIRAAVELWRHHAGVLTDAQRDWTVEVVSRQADHLAHLVDDLLDVSRVTLNKVRLRREIVDLREIVEQARDVMRSQSQLHHIEVVLPATPMRVDGDPVRLRQVLVNLLDNAVKFTPRGGHVILRAGIEAGNAVVRVRDDGVGISPDMIERVFGLFTQGEQPLARTSGGLGLGLPLVRRLVELHGGTVTVQSPGVGRGSEFTVSLPAVRGRITANLAAIDVLEGMSKLRLLVVDDNVDGAQMLGHLLEAHGHHTTLAFDGAGAIEVFDELKPDAVLLDLGLPDIDGLEVARHMRVTAPGVHLIAITGYGDERIRSKVREAGFADHLLKPVELDALRRSLEKVVARGRG